MNELVYPHIIYSKAKKKRREDLEVRAAREQNNAYLSSIKEKYSSSLSFVFFLLLLSFFPSFSHRAVRGCMYKTAVTRPASVLLSREERVYCNMLKRKKRKKIQTNRVKWRVFHQKNEFRWQVEKKLINVLFDKKNYHRYDKIDDSCLIILRKIFYSNMWEKKDVSI